MTSVINKKELDIYKLCNINYQEFIVTVDQLLNVRSIAKNINNEIVDFDQNHENIQKELQIKEDELQDYILVSKNLEIARVALQDAL